MQLRVIMQERTSAALELVRGEYERRNASCRQNALREAEQYVAQKDNEKRAKADREAEAAKLLQRAAKLGPSEVARVRAWWRDFGSGSRAVPGWF